MTKNYLSTILLMLLCIGYAPAQSVTSSNPTTSTAGSAVTLIITGSGTNFNAATGAYIYRPGPNGALYQATNFTANSNTNLTADFNLPPNAPIGNYTVGVYGPTDLANGLSVGIGPGSAYGYLSGYVKYDYNGNCVIDPGEGPLANRIVNMGSYAAVTDANGFYSAWLPLGTYNVSCTNFQQYEFSSCQPGNISLTVPLDSANNVNPLVDTINIYDLVVQFPIYTSLHRPGFNAGATAIVWNFGSGFSLPTTGYFTCNNTAAMTSYNFQGSPFSISGDTAYYNIPALPPTGHFSMYFTAVIDTGTFGIQVGYAAGVTPLSSELNPNNNSSTGGRTINGSYDPNDKQVWTQDNVVADGFIEPSDSLLRYLIRFQNTGTDTAFNIYLRDTLDPNLDISTLLVEDASHDWTMTVTDSASIRWTFPNILLVDSVTNEPESHGYILYSVKLKPGLPIGTQIDNFADIYFDFNSPVRTNTVSSVICPSMQPGFAQSSTGNTVNFTDATLGGPASWVWDFGDGNTSTSQNPSHTYASPGFYQVCLYVTNSCGRPDTACMGLPVNCTPPGSAFNNSAVMTAVNFSDQSSGGPVSWLWDFGDGNTSTAQNPAHTYTSGGVYNVCLIVTSNCGSDTTCQSVTVICPAPGAAFSSTLNGSSASFSDLSNGNPGSWAWSFGDGGTSTLQNPSHTYTSTGTFNVCLIATSNCGSDTTCQSVTVTCTAPTAAFNNTVSGPVVSFTDLSTGSAAGWFWTFGDGGTSIQQNPTHTYNTTGTFNVCLITTSVCGADTSCQSVTIACATPVASFNVQSGTSTVNFIDQSSNSPTQWLWDFGDGNTSTMQHPTHTYTASGTYTACLVASNGCGSDTNCVTLNVLVGLDEALLSRFELYPNPTRDQFVVDLGLREEARVEFRLYSTVGELLLSEPESFLSGDIRKSFDMKDLPVGMYLLEMRVNGRARTWKVMKY